MYYTREMATIVFILTIVFLMLVHNIDLSFNYIRIENELALSEYKIIDCNAITCLEPEKIYMYSIIGAVAITLTISILFMITILSDK